MGFTVRDWMMDLVVIVDPDMPVDEILATMRRRYIHSVIVDKTETNPEYGIITSYDICDKIIAKNQKPAKLKAREIMNSPLIMVHKDMSLQECAQIMGEKRVHHLPVIDDKGKVLGMISATDFVVAAETISRNPDDPIT